MSRVYLDWNATAPLRPEARAAMLAAMDVVGNPSSVHAEGRAARAIVERARGQVARLVGCEPSEVVFTSGATEAANLVLEQRWDVIITGQIEHDASWEAWSRVARRGAAFPWWPLKVEPKGFYAPYDFDGAWDERGADESLKANKTLIAFHAANSETGVFQPVLEASALRKRKPLSAFCDATQAVHRHAMFSERAISFDYLSVSAHKLGGPKGVGALTVASGSELSAVTVGGGQEMGRRSGTENVIGIAGFGAAAEAAQRDLEAGVWDRVENLRNILEETLATAAPETIFVGKDALRLPNTSCFAVPGWKGETQVMQMDLAGYAISAGSACSSGKVKESRVLRAMGFDSVAASSAIRVSMGPTTTEDEVLGFASTWIDHYRRWKARAA